MRQLPMSVKIVAWLYIAFGLMAVADVVQSAVKGKIFINVIAILAPAIGFGLLWRKPFWRKVGVVATCAGIVVVLFALFVIGRSLHDPVQLKMFGNPFSSIRGWQAVTALCSILMFQIWQYWVLTHKRTRELFRE
jgi:riboflavin transporter FmnP